MEVKSFDSIPNEWRTVRCTVRADLLRWQGPVIVFSQLIQRRDFCLGATKKIVRVHGHDPKDIQRPRRGTSGTVMKFLNQEGVISCKLRSLAAGLARNFFYLAFYLISPQ